MIFTKIYLWMLKRHIWNLDKTFRNRFWQRTYVDGTAALKYVTQASPDRTNAQGLSETATKSNNYHTGYSHAMPVRKIAKTLWQNCTFNCQKENVYIMKMWFFWVNKSNSIILFWYFITVGILLGFQYLENKNQSQSFQRNFSQWHQLVWTFVTALY